MIESARFVSENRENQKIEPARGTLIRRKTVGLYIMCPLLTMVVAGAD
jgi:hypothetical protein